MTEKLKSTHTVTLEEIIEGNEGLKDVNKNKWYSQLSGQKNLLQKPF